MANILYLIVLVTFLLPAICCFGFDNSIDEQSDSGPSCKDQNEKYVDWFIVYKLPVLRHSSNPVIRRGAAWAYFGPASDDWTFPELPIDNQSSIPGQIVSQIYDSSNLVILYNDQPPNHPTINSNAHAKGVIVANDKRGFWIVHSIPHFPFSTTQPEEFYPSKGLKEGQLFLCMSFPTTKVLDQVGEIFKYTRPYVFNYSIPENMQGVLPTLEDVAKNGAAVTSPPWFKLFQLPVGNNGFQFQVFAKGPKYQTEIYSQWIAPKLQASLQVQSWLNGPHPIPSSCKTNYPTYNILNKTVEHEMFSTHQDHSKWAVSVGSPTNINTWTCIADLNRMEHQLVRGGASLCTPDQTYWKLFSKLVDNAEPCPKGKS